MLKFKSLFILVIILRFILNDIGYGQSATPLPLVASWNTGQPPANNGYTPDWQITMIDSGYPLMLTVYLPDWRQGLTQSWIDYYQQALVRAAELNIPITLVSTQWESLLYYSSQFRDLPLSDNPCLIDTNNAIQDAVSPFGPVEHWEMAGELWTTSEIMNEIKSLYPNPPLVIMLSNNEANRISVSNIEESSRYINLYGIGHSEEFKRQVLGDHWIERYNAMFAGMMVGLDGWANQIRFVGYYEAKPEFGCPGVPWMDRMLTVNGRLSPSPFMWGGSSSRCYVLSTQPGTSDYTGWSAITEAMNYPFQKEWFTQYNPEYWFEISPWFDTNWVSSAEQQGESITPRRYRGFVTYLTWLTKPTVVRDYMNWDATRISNWQDRLNQILVAITRIHQNPILRYFWEFGNIVPNTSVQHPFQRDIPVEFQNTPRWFLPSSNVNPEPDSRWWIFRYQEFNMWAQVHLIGEAPNRKWLIFAYAPRGDIQNISIEIPDYQSVTIDISQGGTYYIVQEGGSNDYLENFSENLMYGDVDNNRQVQAYDAVTVLKYSTGINTLSNVDPTPWNLQRFINADVDGNGKIQAYDAARILQYTVGLVDTLVP